MPILDHRTDYSTYGRWIKKNAKELLPAAEKKSVFIQVSSNLVLKQLTLQGLGLGFLLEGSIQQELETGELIRLPLPKRIEPIRIEMDVVYKRQHSLGFIHQAFIQHLTDAF